MKLAVLLLLAQFGIADISGNPWWPGVQLPPRQYDHAYAGHLIVREVDRATLAAICGERALGCTLGSMSGQCVVYINRMYHDTVRPVLLAHEIAHCNGWRHE